MNNEIRVWDPLIRIFHWSLVLTFFISYLTGEEESDLHIYAGYAVLGLIIFRLLWGIIGSQYSRFSEFIYCPKEVANYLKQLIDNNPKHYIGHNPLGGWMVIALILSLFVVTVSGLKVYAIEEGLGPLAGTKMEIAMVNNAHADEEEYEKEEYDGEEGYDDEEEHEQEEFWEEIHEISANFTLFLIFLHVLGVILSTKLHKENLVKAMITGKKKTR